MEKSGIYSILNTQTNKQYIGSSVNIYKRWREHKTDLNTGNHHSDHLQKSWNKYGKESFRFEVLAECPREYLIKLEQFFIDTITPEYNVCKIAGSGLGYKHTIDVKQRLSKLNKGRKHTEQSRKNMSNGQKQSEASKKHIEKIHNLHKKVVYKYDLHGNFIGKYDSVSDAAKSVSGTAPGLAIVCRGGGKTYKGFQWRYEYSGNIHPTVKGEDKTICVLYGGKIVGMYKTIKEASIKFSVAHSGISAHLRGAKGRKTFAGGHTAKVVTLKEYENYTLQK